MTTDLLVFRLGQQRFALPVGQVSRAVPRATLEPLPNPPPDVIGMLRLHGELLPVVDLRTRLRLPTDEPHIGECILVVRTASLRVGLLAQGVDGVVPMPPDRGARGVLEAWGHVATILDANEAFGNQLTSRLAA